MSNYLAIASVTAALQNLILKGLQSAPWGFANEVAVTVSPPDAARTRNLESSDQINLFLYQLSPNAAWRNETLPGQTNRNETGQPPLALDLLYLISAFSPNNDGVEAHRLLGRALSVLHDHAVLSATELQASVPHADLHQQMERIRLVPHAMSVEEMSKLWTMFQKPYQVSVVWKASVVLIESTRSVHAPLPVLQIGRHAEGVTVQPDVDSPFPRLDAVEPPGERPSARIGDLVTARGRRLAGDVVRVAIQHSRWTAPQLLAPQGGSDRWTSFTLTLGSDPDAALPAGVYTCAVQVTARPGDPVQVSNEVPFTLASRIISINPTSATPDGDGNIALTVNVSPQVRADQRLSLIAGDVEVRSGVRNAPQSALSFTLPGLTPGKYRLRLRVDGVDSIVVDRGTTPPSYVGPELEVT